MDCHLTHLVEMAALVNTITVSFNVVKDVRTCNVLVGDSHPFDALALETAEVSVDNRIGVPPSPGGTCPYQMTTLELQLVRLYHLRWAQCQSHSDTCLRSVKDHGRHGMSRNRLSSAQEGKSVHLNSQLLGVMSKVRIARRSRNRSSVGLVCVSRWFEQGTLESDALVSGLLQASIAMQTDAMPF